MDLFVAGKRVDAYAIGPVDMGTPTSLEMSFACLRISDVRNARLLTVFLL